jgi:hypothetical protein
VQDPGVSQILNCLQVTCASVCTVTDGSAPSAPDSAAAAEDGGDDGRSDDAAPRDGGPTADGSDSN